MRTCHGSSPAHTQTSTVNVYPYFHWSTVNFTYDVARDPRAWTSDSDPRQQLFDEVREAARGLNGHRAPETAEHWQEWVYYAANSVSSCGKWSNFTICVWETRSPWLVSADSGDPARLNEQQKYSELKTFDRRLGLGAFPYDEGVPDSPPFIHRRCLWKATTVSGEDVDESVLGPLADEIEVRSETQSWLNAASAHFSLMSLEGRWRELNQLMTARMIGVAWDLLRERGINNVELWNMDSYIYTTDPPISDSKRMERAWARLLRGKRYIPQTETDGFPPSLGKGDAPDDSGEAS